MQELGAELMLLCSNVRTDALGDRETLLGDLALIAERAGARGLRVGYEALAWGRHVKTARCLDAGAAGRSSGAGGDSRQFPYPGPGRRSERHRRDSRRADLLRAAGRCARAGHGRAGVEPALPLFPRSGRVRRQGSSRRCCRPATAGRCRWRCSTTGFAPRRPGHRRRWSACAVALEELTGQRLATSVSSAPAAQALFAPPPAPRYEGIDFLEFAVDEPHAARLGNWLQQLGFAHVGQHRSKEVQLYRQGEINIVLNAEPYSFAHNYFEAHGLGVRHGAEDRRRGLGPARACASVVSPIVG